MIKRAKSKNKIFTDEGIENIMALYAILLSIHKRLIKEGYVVKNGRIILPGKNDL